MGLRLTVELVCDARRAPGCHGSYAVQGDALTSTVFEAREGAAATGWTRERGGGGRMLDVCPACRAPSTRSGAR